MRYGAGELVFGSLQIVAGGLSSLDGLAEVGEVVDTISYRDAKVEKSFVSARLSGECSRGDLPTKTTVTAPAIPDAK